MQQPTTAPPEKYWAIIELFGHQRMAGEITEKQFGSEMMFQVDVPAFLNSKQEVEIEQFTQFINPKAIYRLTPCSELLARAAVQSIAHKPVHVFNGASDIKLILEGNPKLNPAFYQEEE